MDMQVPSRPGLNCVNSVGRGDPLSQIRLNRVVADVERVGNSSLGDWRGAALRGLIDVREVLVDEAAAASSRNEARSTVVLRERAVLLDRISLLRLHVLGVEEVDRLSYDVRRLVADVRDHLDQLPTQPGRN